MTEIFDASCRLCPRLAGFLDDLSSKFPDYHNRPVAPFGDPDARLLIVGLAPGMHGANRSGRPFTGDHAGILLYQMLYDFGFGNRPVSVSRDDGLQLSDCRITNAVKCLPPDNKPVGAEINTCNGFLRNELLSLRTGSVVLALGGIAHKAIVRALQLRQADFKFGHGNVHEIAGGIRMLDSYHCSRYNTNTGRLTQDMFREVFAEARSMLGP